MIEQREGRRGGRDEWTGEEKGSWSDGEVKSQ